MTTWPQNTLLRQGFTLSVYKSWGHLETSRNLLVPGLQHVTCIICLIRTKLRAHMAPVSSFDWNLVMESAAPSWVHRQMILCLSGCHLDMIAYLLSSNTTCSNRKAPGHCSLVRWATKTITKRNKIWKKMLAFHTHAMLWYMDRSCSSKSPINEGVN